MIISFGNKRGVILITALWIVTILTIFAVSVGRQSAVSLKLASNNADRLKAYFIARAGILRAIEEKGLEYKNARSVTIDALSERWANDKKFFCEHKLGDGMYTVGYEYNETAKNSEKENFLYGLMDEQSRININYAPLETFKNLLEYFGIEPEEARGIASAIIDWRDEDGNVTSQEGVFYGAEDEYYMGLMPSYHCKNLQFDTIYELILVKGVTQDIFNKIKGHITVYGDGRVNINTADEVVLKAVFGPVFPNLASKILKYRLGPDEIIGTKDDRWFCEGPYVMDRKEEGLVAIKNLQEAEWYANIYGITTEEYNRIKELVNNAATRQLGTNSSAYRAIVTGEVKHITSRIEAVYVFEGKDKPPAVKFWHQQ